MKEIMHGETQGADDVGEFTFVTDLSPESLPLFHPRREQARRAILDELKSGTKSVKLFCEDWVYRPEDYMTARQYKDILLELEREGLVEVVDIATGVARPATKRMRKGKVTLGETCALKLRSRSS